MIARWAVVALAPVLFSSVRLVGAFWIARSTILPRKDCVGILRYNGARRHRTKWCDMVLKDSNRAGNQDGACNEGSSNEEKSRKKLTAVRVGGRSVKLNQRSPIKDSQPNLMQRYWIPSLIGLLLIWSLGGTGRNAYFYSYSSYSFETSSYNNNGVLDVKREESANFRSNIPGLRNDPSILSDLRRDNQRLLEQQEQEYLDAFSSNVIRAMETMMDESWE